MKATPYAMLVGPSGTILFQGDPRKMDEALITDALPTALQVPLYDCPVEVGGAKTAFHSGKQAEALSKAEADPKIKEAVRAVIDGRVERLREAAKIGDWMSLDDHGGDLADAIKSLPEEAELRELLKELKSNKEAKKALKAQRQIAKLFAKKITSSKVDGVMKKVEKIASDFPADSGVGRDAARAKARLESLR